MASEWFISNHILTPGSPVLGAISGILSAASAVAVMQPIDTAGTFTVQSPRSERVAAAAALTRHLLTAADAGIEAFSVWVFKLTAAAAFAFAAAFTAL